MKIVHPLLERPITFTENEVQVLAIENQHAFTSFVSELVDQTNGSEGDFVFSREDVPVALSKEAEIIINPLNLDCNQRRIVNRLFTILSDLAIGEDFYLETVTLRGAICQYIQKLTEGVPFPLAFNEEPGINDILKAAGVHFDFESSSFLSRLIDYFTVLQDFCHISLFVLVNIKTWLNQDDLLQLYKDAEYKKYTLFLIENSVQKSELPQEVLRIIDDDLCEI